MRPRIFFENLAIFMVWGPPGPKWPLHGASDGYLQSEEAAPVPHAPPAQLEKLAGTSADPRANGEIAAR